MTIPQQPRATIAGKMRLSGPRTEGEKNGLVGAGADVGLGVGTRACLRPCLRPRRCGCNCRGRFIAPTADLSACVTCSVRGWEAFPDPRTEFPVGTRFIASAGAERVSILRCLLAFDVFGITPTHLLYSLSEAKRSAYQYFCFGSSLFASFPPVDD